MKKKRERVKNAGFFSNSKIKTKQERVSQMTVPSFVAGFIGMKCAYSRKDFKNQLKAASVFNQLNILFIALKRQKDPIKQAKRSA